MLASLSACICAGYLVYHGPRENVLDFFEPLGFRCPERKGVADFLQEVTSRKDQQVRPICAPCFSKEMPSALCLHTIACL